jgi:hypothetical protein
VNPNFSSKLHITAAAPAVKASNLASGNVEIEFGELAVVPMTCRRERPASFRSLALDFDFEDLGFALEGVSRTPQGPTLRREFVGVAIYEGTEKLRLTALL